MPSTVFVFLKHRSRSINLNQIQADKVALFIYHDIRSVSHPYPVPPPPSTFKPSRSSTLYISPERTRKDLTIFGLLQLGI